MEGHKYAVITQYEKDGWVVLGTSNSYDLVKGLLESSTETHYEKFKLQFDECNKSFDYKDNEDLDMSRIMVKRHQDTKLSIYWRCKIVKTDTLPQFGIIEY